MNEVWALHLSRETPGPHVLSGWYAGSVNVRGKTVASREHLPLLDVAACAYIHHSSLVCHSASRLNPTPTPLSPPCRLLPLRQGTLSFSLVSQDMATTKKIPGLITGITAPVCAAVCIQSRNDSVTLVDDPHAPRSRTGLQSAGRNRRGVADGQQQQQQQQQQVAEGPKLDPAARDAARRRLFGLSSEQFEGRLAMIERRRKQGGGPGGLAGSTGAGHVRGSLDSASAAAAPRPASRSRPLSGSLCDLRKNHFSDFDAAIGVGAAFATVAKSPRSLIMQDGVVYHGGSAGYTGGVGGGYRPDVVTTPPRSWHRVLSSDPSSCSPRLSPHFGARRVGHAPAASRGVDDDEQLINSYMGISNLKTGEDWTPAPAALSSPLTVVGLQVEGGGGAGGAGGVAGSGGAREVGVGPWRFGRDAGQSPPGKKLTFERSSEGKHSVLEGRGIMRRGQGGERRSEPLVVDGALSSLHLGSIAQSGGAPVGGGENLYQKVVMSKILALSQQSRGGGGKQQNCQKGVSPKSADKAGARARPSMSGSPNSRQAKKFFGGASRGPG